MSRSVPAGSGVPTQWQNHPVVRAIGSFTRLPGSVGQEHWAGAGSPVCLVPRRMPTVTIFLEKELGPVPDTLLSPLSPDLLSVSSGRCFGLQDLRVLCLVARLVQTNLC